MEDASCNTFQVTGRTYICAANNRVTVHVGETVDDLRKDSDPGFYPGTILSGNNETGKYQVNKVRRRRHLHLSSVRCLG